MTSNSKIEDLDELATVLHTLQVEGEKIVHCHGVFDLLHVGHIRYFEEARAMGDVLVVTLTQDQFVNKGPNRPAFSQELRAHAIASLEAVDYVAINRWPTSVETIQLLRPDIYVKGGEFKDELDLDGAVSQEAQTIRDIGGEIRFTDDTVTFSSSNLLNRYISPFSEETIQYLATFRQQHTLDEVLDWLERIATLKPVVVGEAIIDEYVFGVGIGKSTKDPVLAVHQQSIEAYVGGSLAIANHLAGLCNQVALIAQLGENDRDESFVRQGLHPHVNPVFLTKPHSPTIHKRRIVDRYSGNKLLEIYVMNADFTTEEDEIQLCRTLENALPAHDVAVVADYGHGMLTPASIDVLCRSASFLAVNVQSNAGNHGFNPVSKYRRADYICLASYEIDIETRHRQGPVKDRIMELAERIDCSRFTVTLGKDGSIHLEREVGFTHVPALATRVHDRVGAGDAVLAVTSLLVHLGAPWDIVGFIGNAAGAHLVAELGNRVPLDRTVLSKQITALMK